MRILLALVMALLVNSAFSCDSKLLDHNFRRLATSETVNYVKHTPVKCCLSSILRANAVILHSMRD